MFLLVLAAIFLLRKRCGATRRGAVLVTGSQPSARITGPRGSGSPPHVFISFRFNEASTEALALKAALEAAGKRVFISDVQGGDNIEQVICDAIEHCLLVVVLGTTTYGLATTSFSTYHEINYTFDEAKPFYLVKMTERWQEAHVRMKFGQRTMYTLWMPGEPMPANLVENIVAKLDGIEATATPDEPLGVVSASTTEDAVAEPEAIVVSLSQ